MHEKLIEDRGGIHLGKQGKVDFFIVEYILIYINRIQSRGRIEIAN